MRHKVPIAATLVVVATSVLTQWTESLRRFAPTLKIQVIDNAKALRAFTLDPDVDVVLIKSGYVTKNFVVEGEKPRPERLASRRPIVGALAALTENRLWNRLIIDDFDTINLSPNEVEIPAAFTWYVSATRLWMYDTWRNVHIGSIPDLYRRRHPLPMFVAVGDMFSRCLEVRCDQKYVDDHIQSTTATFRQIVVKGGFAVGVLKSLGVSSEVLEMVAAGASEMAATALKIKADGVGDLLRRVLADRSDEYVQASRALSRAGEVSGESVITDAHIEYVSSGEPRPTPAADDGQPLGDRREELDKMVAALTERRAAAGEGLERMRSNIKEEACQCCKVPIDGDAYVTGCCQIIVCGYCTVDDCKKYIDRCPNCSRVIHPGRDLIYVGSDVDLMETLTDGRLLQADPEDVAGPPDVDVYPPRLAALLRLVAGQPFTNEVDHTVDPFVGGLLPGRRQAPPAPRHRYFVVAMHKESAREIHGALKKTNTPFEFLSGRREERDRAVARFKAGEVDILLGTTSLDSASLHLPEVTRVVLYHHHLDVNVTRQAVGRAWRVGRTYSLEVIRIVSEGELANVVAG